jgi:serine protease Do
LSFVVAAISFVVAQEMPAPGPRVERRVEVIVNDGGGFLGVQPVEVTKENSSKFGLREVRGVAIEKVIENSPAAAAGLQNGDVILRFNGEEVTGMRKLMRLIGETAPDHQARLTILRGGDEKEFTITMGKHPERRLGEGALNLAIPMPQAPEFPRSEMPMRIPFGNGEENVFVFHGGGRQIGVGVAPLTKQLGEYFGVADGKGLLVNDVRENSPAAKAGIRAGDVIIEAEGKPVDGMAPLIRAINEKKEGEVTLTVIRNKDRKIFKVTPEKSSAPAVPGMEEIEIEKIGEAPVSPRVKVQIAPAVGPNVRMQHPPIIL